MELKNVFGIAEYLNEHNAMAVYDTCKGLLKRSAYTSRGLLASFKVEYVGTTDEPWDSLEHHTSLAAENYSIRVSPSFRPDKILQLGNKDAFFHNIQLLAHSSGVIIKDISSLLEALQNRVDFFHSKGCRVSDHGLFHMPGSFTFSAHLEKEFASFITTRQGTYSDPETFMGYVLAELCKMYHAKGWVQQFHLGPIRNNNTRLNKKLGADSGFDSIGDFPQALQMSRFFDHLDQTDQLAKTVIYNINPSDNEVFASMLG